MPKPDRSTGKVRFGDFELDLRAAEFHREGKGTIRLPEQPFQILAMLLERPGEVVSQEEIRKRLWPNDTIAEFEHSISAAMNRVRQALGDSANDPDYIETLPRRGYRWKVAVEWVAAPPAADGAPRPKTASRVPVTVLFALVLLTIGAGLSAWLWSRSMAQPPVKISLATTLAGFERNPSFSPDGNEIAFVHFDTDTRDLNIFVKTLGDERVVQLTHTPPPGASDCPSWSPDGTTIAYNRSIETSATTSVAAIFLMTARGGSQRQLRPVSSDASCQMSWAPDSKSLAYGDAPPGQNPGIFLIPSSGSPVRRLTTAPPTTTDGDPAFSPDGTEVASIRWSSSTTSDLYRASTTNGQITRVTVLNRRVVSPVWTSDGKRLIFGINGGFWGTNALFSVATTSAEPESLPFISSPSVFTPALSRQEDKLAFATGFSTRTFGTSRSGNRPPRIPLRRPHKTNGRVRTR